MSNTTTVVAATTTKVVQSAGLFSTIGVFFGLIQRSIYVADTCLGVVEDLADTAKAHSTSFKDTSLIELSTKLTKAERKAELALAEPTPAA